MQDLHTGANNEQPVQKCSMWLEAFSELERTTNRRVDSAEAGMTAAIADTHSATVEQQYEQLHCTGWSVAKQLFAKCGQCGITDHHDAPTLCRRLTLNLRHPAYSKTLPHLL